MAGCAPEHWARGRPIGVLLLTMSAGNTSWVLPGPEEPRSILGGWMTLRAAENVDPECHL